MANTPTPFQSRVYEALKEIPVGRVITYKELATRLDCGSCQAIGQALRRNPYAPEVPCHRVITSNHTLGGYSGQTSGPVFEKKILLLKKEGVLFDEKGRLIDPGKMWQFPRL